MVAATEFIPIDLYSQRMAIAQYIADWSIEEVLNWLHCFGSVQKGTDETYLFWSVTGLTSIFRFDEHGKIVIPNVYGWI